MKNIKVLALVAACACAAFYMSQAALEVQKPPTFDDAIEIIKKFEGLHKARHWPLVGYGHKVMPGEKFKRGKVLSEADADKLVREDYAKLCARYRAFGADSLLLAALAYNCGPGVVARSSVLAKLKAGDRDIESAYKAHCRYRGRQLKQLRRRRETELAALFVKDPSIVEVKKMAEIQKPDSAEVVLETVIVKESESI